MGTLAFFPWWHIEEPTVVGSFELVPFDREHTGAEGADSRATIEAINGPYQDSYGQPLGKMTLLRHAGSSFGCDLTDAEVSDFFAFAELVAFSGLAERRLFSDDYCNRDNFRLVIQGFTEPGDGVATTHRRRDGRRTVYHTSEVYRAGAPPHIELTPCQIDWELLGALVSRDADAGLGCVMEAIQSFNLANTDRPDISEQLELVLSYGAFERLFGLAGGKDRDVQDAIEAVLKPGTTVSPQDCGRLANRPGLLQKESLRASWMQDLGNARADFAHGKMRAPYPAAWSPREHLALASALFPLCVKLQIGFDLSGHAVNLIDSFEKLAATDFLVPERPDGSHPWREILRLTERARMKAECIRGLEQLEREDET